MRPPDERGGGHRPRLRTGPAAKQLRRQFLASGKDTAQLDLEDYRDEMATAAQEAGMRGADFTSPDWIRRAVGYIYALEPGELATGDDLRRELGSAPSPGAPGVAINWLQIVTRGAGTRGSTVRLRGRQRYPLCPSKRQGLVGTVQCLTHDLWRHDGLGKSTGRVYELLTAEPASAEEIGSRLGVKRRAATVHLTKLKRRELADYVTDGWVRGPADPDLLAVEFGAAGTADRQRQRHRERVALRREYLTRHSAVRREEGRWAWWQTWWESLQSEVAVSRAW